MPFHRPPAGLTVGDIAGSWADEPCRGEAVSGDGFFVEIGRSDSHLLLLLVDVMGHGAAAAQTVDLLAKLFLRDSACQQRTPAELLRTLHGMLQQEWAATGRFVAALALLVEGQAGTLTAGNAALPEPWVRQPGQTWQSWSVPGGPPLGLPFPDADYQDDRLHLASGQLLLAFTDGVSEAGAAQGRQFQHGPLQTFLASLPGGLATDGVVATLLQALRAHVGANWPEDDTTILCLRRG
jgi:sigma-B regulation protein RsbU (phosphoserine phosphatase)